MGTVWEATSSLATFQNFELLECFSNFLSGNRIYITSEHASATVGRKRGRGKLEPIIPGMKIDIPKSPSGDISQSDSESDHNASKSAATSKHLIKMAMT